MTEEVGKPQPRVWEAVKPDLFVEVWGPDIGWFKLLKLLQEHYDLRDELIVYREGSDEFIHQKHVTRVYDKETGRLLLTISGA